MASLPWGFESPLSHQLLLPSPIAGFRIEPSCVRSGTRFAEPNRRMRYLALPAALLLAVSCGGAASRKSAPAPTAPSELRTIDNVPVRPSIVDPPPMLQDEMPLPKPKVMPWETATPVVMSPEDEKLRANLPFSPAIAMDPIDGSKISIRANTPTPSSLISRNPTRW